MNIKEYLREHKIMADGAMGTYFESLEKNVNPISEYANLSDRDKIKKIHKEYLNAGANILRTNTFAANTAVLGIDEEEQKKIICSAFETASQAAAEFFKENGEKKEPVYIAADIGPIPENGSSREEELKLEYERMCRTFLQQGAEVFLFETFPDLKYIRDLAAMIKKEKEQAFIIATFCLNKNGYTASGIKGARLLEEVSGIEWIDACGFNCGIGSGHMYRLLKKMIFPGNKYIAVLPNAGYPEQLHNRMVFLDNASYFADNMKRIAGLGIDIIGGCCGTTPGYMKKVKEKAGFEQKERPSVQVCSVEEKEETVCLNHFYEKLCSGKKVIAVELDPPYDAEDEKILECSYSLKAKGVDILTFADSPMGRSRADSIMTGIKVKNEVDMDVMPHICCRDKNMISMRSGILGAYMNGIRNFLIVTGDPVPNVSRASTTGVFDYNSHQLMEFVREMNREHFKKEPVYYGGALNYNRGKLSHVLKKMETKINAGAAYFLTQPIYSDEDIERIYQIKKNTDTKILCGIMPLVSYRNANFIKNEITGIHVPDEIINRYHKDMDREEAQLVGAQIASEIIEKLSSIADGYYFMLPFNRVSLMDQIVVK